MSLKVLFLKVIFLFLFFSECFSFSGNKFYPDHTSTYASITNRNYNITHAVCNWTIDPSVNFIDGEISYNFIPETLLDTMSLDLADPITVDSIIYNSNSILFVHSNNILQIFFQAALPPLVTNSISIFYHGSPVATNGRSFISDVHSGVPVVYTLSEPYGARDWWPCKQDLDDKIDTIDIVVTSPLGYRTASNGLLVQEDSTMSTRTCHWHSNYPIATYLVGVGVTNYSVVKDSMVLQNGDTLPILNYIYPESVPIASAVLPEIKNIIHLYDSLTITYPFSKEKYGHAEFNVGGGMEHQTMSFIGNYSLGLIAHECAHQWFGDLVTCSSFHDVWLNEGFATYLTGLTDEYLYPGEWSSWKAAALAGCTTKPDGSVYCDDTVNISRMFDAVLSYNRGAYLLHMIRWKIGDDNFFAALKSYLTDVSLSYNYAGTSDLQHHFEITSSISLQQFFDEWYYGSGFPSYKIQWQRNGTDVEVNLFQSSSDSSTTFYHIPVMLELQGENRDTSVTIDPQYSGEQFILHPGFATEKILFDPELWILSASNSVSEIDNSTDKISVYPNPSDNIFSIYSKRNELAPQSVKVFDVAGRIVYSRIFSEILSRQKIDLGDKPAGNYFFEIQTSQGKFVKKVQLVH